MAQRILEPGSASDSPVNFTCNYMGFSKNPLSSVFDGHFSFLTYYFMIPRLSNEHR